MKFKVDGRELSAERMRVGETVEAEKFLGVDMETSLSAKIAVCLYVAMRRDDEFKTMKPHLLADKVMAVDLTSVDVVDTEEEAEAEAGPPEETVAENGAGDRENLRTTGPQPSVTT